MAAHSTLTGINLHENKGVDTASNNTVATASGSTTVWQKVNASMVDPTSIFSMNKAYLTLDIVDISTAETIYLPIPFAGTLIGVYTSLQNAITLADSIITIVNNGGSTAGTITVAFTGSAAGDVDSVAPTVNNTFTLGQKVRVTTDGGSTTTARLTVVLVFTVTG